MKKFSLLMCLVSAMVLTGCKNNQVGDEALLMGKWKIVKVRITGNQGAGIETSSAVLDDNQTWEFTEKNAIYRAQDSTNTPYERNWLYKLNRQKNNTLLIEFNGLATGEEIGKQPISIHKLTATEIEWEHVYYGGDEGPLTIYEYLKRTTDE